MSSDSNLKRARLACYALKQITIEGDDLIADEVNALVSKFEELDKFLSSGGPLPTDWQVKTSATADETINPFEYEAIKEYPWKFIPTGEEIDKTLEAMFAGQTPEGKQRAHEMLEECKAEVEARNMPIGNCKCGVAVYTTQGFCGHCGR